jgi:hypothetical protein
MAKSPYLLILMFVEILNPAFIFSSAVLSQLPILSKMKSFEVAIFFFARSIHQAFFTLWFVVEWLLGTLFQSVTVGVQVCHRHPC